MREQPLKISDTKLQVLEWQKLALLAIILFVIMLLGEVGRSNDSVEEEIRPESPMEQMAKSAGH